MSAGKFTPFRMLGQPGFESDLPYPGFIGANGMLYVADDEGVIRRRENISDARVDLPTWRRSLAESTEQDLADYVAENLDMIMDAIDEHVGRPKRGRHMQTRAAVLGIVREMAMRLGRSDLADRALDQEPTT